MNKMKKQTKYGFIALALCLGLTANGQDLDYGVKAGALYHMPSYGNKSVSNDDAQFGVQAGIFARTSDKLYVQGEITFSTFKSAYNFQQKKYDPTFYQLNVPVHVGYKIVEIDQLTVRTSLGSQLNYNLKKNNATPNSNFNTLICDGFVNIGTDINRFAVDLRYNHSINRTSKDLDSRSRIIGLSVGYNF